MINIIQAIENAPEIILSIGAVLCLLPLVLILAEQIDEYDK